MAARRLTPGRMASIAAWTAASVTWSTAVVALVNGPEASVEAPTADEVALPPPVEQEEVVLESMPAMPESGLVVLRYTAVERPKAQVVVRRVVTAGSGGGTTQAATPAPTKTKSSGS
ncbi:MAG: hypothetical protein ABFS21_02695 [Actinomycetota bacterium]